MADTDSFSRQRHVELNGQLQQHKAHACVASSLLPVRHLTLVLCTVSPLSDTVVHPFDPQSIDAQCFGGHERIERFAANGRATMQRWTSHAFLRFYTRHNKRAEESVSPPATAVALAFLCSAVSVAAGVDSARPRC